MTAATDGIVIRRAVPSDAAALVELSREVASEPEGWLITTGWRSAAEERRYLRALRGHPDAAVLVAEAPEGLVGRLSLARDSHPASSHVADLGLLVGQERRRQGIGRALLEAAMGWARDSGVLKLELHVFPHNGPAIALYEEFGFRREGYRARHYRRGDGGYVDAILMARDVASPQIANKT
jgi:RimJ/RimL family protein N-acetyltransferase